MNNNAIFESISRQIQDKCVNSMSLRLLVHKTANLCPEKYGHLADSQTIKSLLTDNCWDRQLRDLVLTIISEFFKVKITVLHNKAAPEIFGECEETDIVLIYDKMMDHYHSVTSLNCAGM